MKELLLMAFVVWGSVSWAQDVHVSEGKGGSLVLSVAAEKSYDLVTGEKRRPVLSVQCAVKGKKNLHLVMFSAQGTFSSDNPEAMPKNQAMTFDIEMGGVKETTTWIPYGDAITFAYYGKTEPERAKFLQHLMAAQTLSVEFTPFLTGVPLKSTFDLAKLHDAVNGHSQCDFN